MGGSGGSFDPSRVKVQVRELENKVESAEYEAEVAHLLGSVLSDANDRDVAAIQTHLGVIEEAIGKDVDGFVDLLFGGSVSKNTYVAGLSDVDALVVIDESSLAHLGPTDVVKYIVERLRERLPNTAIEVDGFAISVKYADGIVQLVPVRRNGAEYLLPTADCRQWSRVRPHSFTDALTGINKDQGGKVVPTIKLAKVVLADMPDSRRPSGYHLELLAVDAFAGYDGPRTPKRMLTHFFESASERVLSPISDPTGQSQHVDATLGPSGSLDRQILSDALGRVARRFRNADGAQDIGQWKRVLGII